MGPQDGAPPAPPRRRRIRDPGPRWGDRTTTRDEHIYGWYREAGRFLPDVGEALAQRVHDLSIDDALGDLIGETPEARRARHIVGIMGGHRGVRGTTAYEQAARVAWRLGKDHLVVTGGGPGVMERGTSAPT
jgi:hypothetical protein